MDKSQLLQPDLTKFLFKNKKFYHDSHLQALNNDVFNVLTIDEQFSKETLPDQYANFFQTAFGIDQFNQQIDTFSYQSNILSLTDPENQSENIKKIDEVVVQIKQARDQSIEFYDKMAVHIKGTQFFNALKLNDIFLVNDKGVSQMDDEEFENAKQETAASIYGNKEDSNGTKEQTNNPIPTENNKG